MKKDKIITNIIENKRIILWGTGKTANTFIKKYGNSIPIYACTSNESDIVPVGNLITINPCEIKVETDFVIICSIYYEEIRYQLMCMDGFKLHNNFMNHNIFVKLYESEVNCKRIIVAIGQCEIRGICNVLEMLCNFRKKYVIYYFDEQKVCMHGNMYNLAETRECIELLKKSDFFIKPSVLKPQSMKSFQFLQKNLKANCKIVTVSLFNMDSYWAQDIGKERAVNKYYMAKKDMKLCAYIERDQVVEKLIDKGYSVRRILNLVNSQDLFSKEDVLENHNNTIKRAKIADRISTIKMSDFVGENFNKIKLYCDRGHFNENLLKEYVKRLLFFFEDKKSIDELIKIDISFLMMNVNELPIYPSTASILDLNWVSKDTLYRQRRYDGVKLVTFEEYMEAFIQYCKYTKQALHYSYWKL